MAYYEDCRIGLGLEFLEEVYVSIQRILAFPEAWTMLSANSRRCLTNRFPYGVVYQILDADTIRIIAIMELHQKPGYWQSRA
jgi:hypothetical protein